MAVAPISKPVPAMIGTIFGGVWALIAVMALPPSWRFPMALLAGMPTIIFVVRHWRASPAPSPEGRLLSRKSYQIALGVEIAAICVASAMLPRVGLQSYFIEVLGIIVGLHFIGLWHATRSKRFLWIAAGMCIASAFAIALPAALGSLHLRDAATGLANALVLWFGASRSGRYWGTPDIGVGVNPNAA